MKSTILCASLSINKIRTIKNQTLCDYHEERGGDLSVDYSNMLFMF